jgi:hypothetical protein
MTPKKMNTILKVVLGLLILVTIGGLYFANRKLVDIANATSKMRAEIELSQKQLDAYTLTKIKVESLDYANGLAAKVLPDSVEQSVIVAEVSEFALRANLGVSQIGFPDKASSANTNGKKTATPKGVDITPITIQFKEGAKYENILEFLRYVENNQRRMQVVNIDLKPDEKDRSQLSTVTVLMNLYVKKKSEAKL